MSRLLYILTEDRLAIPCASTLEWAMWFERHPNANRVALDECEGYRVSTIFLGVDYNFTGCGDPVLFETMVFSEHEDLAMMDRYHTWAEALAGHERIRSICAREWADAKTLALATVRNVLKQPEVPQQT